MVENWEKINTLTREKLKIQKPMFIMLLCLLVVFGLVFGYKIFKNIMIAQYFKSMGAPVSTVATMKASKEAWQPKLMATGTLRAVKGVDVTTEIAGLVRQIKFQPGQEVQANEIIVELNDDAEVAALHSLQAETELAKITYDRDKAQYDVKAISKAQLDTDAANLKSKQAQVEQQEATIAKKILRAPFSGRLGISLVNPGQYLNPGDKVVTLQALNPIYVDFTLPQQNLLQVGVGQSVRLTLDTFPGRIFTGKITTTEPKVDPATRNIMIEATIVNEDHALLPGMFANVEVDTGIAKEYITLPQTAISFNPYGEIIYTIKEEGKDKKGKPILKAYQSFVTVGERRGDQIAIIKGVKEGDVVVVSGQLKLKNGSVVTINNTIMPRNEANPKPVRE